MTKRINSLDQRIIAGARHLFVPIARVAFFVVFFYFGFLKVIGLSPATPLAEALTSRTIGLEHFHAVYVGLALLECLIGVLFLIPKATRIVIPLLFVHLIVVSSPLVLLSGHVFDQWFVPNFEGQYIMKNIVLVAAAIGIAAQTPPLRKKRK